MYCQKKEADFRNRSPKTFRLLNCMSDTSKKISK